MLLFQITKKSHSSAMSQHIIFYSSSQPKKLLLIWQDGIMMATELFSSTEQHVAGSVGPVT
jgi:hypothetical protein